MADEPKVLVQRVRFTGKRTGLESIAIKGYGRVSQGQTIEVTAEEAERYTAKLPMRNGEEGSDFSKVGGEFEVDKSDVLNRRIAAREKLVGDEDPADLLPDEVNTEMAHETIPDHGTVEEYAEVVTTPPADEAEGESKKGASKK